MEKNIFTTRYGLTILSYRLDGGISVSEYYNTPFEARDKYKFPVFEIYEYGDDSTMAVKVWRRGTLMNAIYGFSMCVLGKIEEMLNEIWQDSDVLREEELSVFITMLHEIAKKDNGL